MQVPEIFITILAECPQYYCGEIRQMLTFHINHCCPKAYHRPDHSIRIVEYDREKIVMRKLNIFTGTRTRDSFRVCNLCSCNLPAETNNFVLGSLLLSCLITELQKPSSPGLDPRTDFRVYGLCPVISSLKQTTLVLAPFFYRA
jgi:hypothetical protein